VDNSEYMRNGDCFPTRMEVQTDAVNMVMGWKYQSNPENTVGVMKMARSPEVLVTPSPDIGKILSALHTLKIDGAVDLLASIQVAQLALKHRQNKNQHQRMIIFIGSPLHHVDSRALSRLGATLKKNNVAVDVISFGDTDANAEKLSDFVKAVNSNDNSHLVTVEPGTRPLPEAIRHSPVYGGGSGDTGDGSSSGASDFPFGIDPNEDPELLLALRASLEDAQKREQEGGGGATVNKDNDVKDSSSGPVPPAEEDEEELLKQAILLSLNTQNNATSPMDIQPTHEQGPMDLDVPTQVPQDATQEPAKTEPVRKPSETMDLDTKATTHELGAVMNDPTFVHDILKSLPGVDFDDPQIKNILAEVGHGQTQASQGEENDEDLEKALKMSLDLDKEAQDKNKDNKEGQK